MGFFDSVEQTTDTFNGLHPKEALALAGLSMIMADGEFEQEEFMALEQHTAISEKTRKRAHAVMEQEPATDKHIELVTEALKTDDQRLACLTVLLDIAMADGNLASSEKDLFEKYIEAFGVKHEPLKDVFEILSIKNNPTTFI